jgi:hypothetical protein
MTKKINDKFHFFLLEILIFILVRSLPGGTFGLDFCDHIHLKRVETTLETTPVTISACHMNLINTI